MNIKDYLNRINYTGAVTPNLDVLTQLQKSHILNVPFENLDIHYENRINLDIDNFYHKVVNNERGGFCYELNGLFNTLLHEIGFKTNMISARVYDSKKEEFGKEYDHLAIMVELNQTVYLVDVGFGEFVFQPLEFKLDTIQTDPRGDFVIEKTNNEYYQVSKITGQDKSVAYIFANQKRELGEFSDMCHYHQTDSRSHFTQKNLISRPTETGRITLTGNNLKVTDNNRVIKDRTFSEEEFGTYLKDWFGMAEPKTRTNP